MAHLHHDRKKLLNRVRRIRGQLDAIERAIEEEKEASATLQTIAACRGAMNGLMQQVIEGHVRYHVLDPHRKPSSDQEEATEELLAVLRAYLR